MTEDAGYYGIDGGGTFETAVNFNGWSRVSQLVSETAKAVNERMHNIVLANPITADKRKHRSWRTRYYLHMIGHPQVTDGKFCCKYGYAPLIEEGEDASSAQD